MARILVIEDDDAVRGLVLRHLVAAGYEVQDAANGKMGLASYRQQRSDLVITDIVMPETEGLETIRELRRVNPQVKSSRSLVQQGAVPTGILTWRCVWGLSGSFRSRLPALIFCWSSPRYSLLNDHAQDGRVRRQP
jgi:CheY-like chemotaxis protein